MNYCYADRLDNFMKISKDTWLQSVQDSFVELCKENAHPSQVSAWDDCFDVLREQLNDLASTNPGIYIIFEYVIRYTSKKRPDVLLLAKNKLVILEFKRKSVALLEDRLQTEEYARKLFRYHKNCHQMTEIVPALVLSQTTSFRPYKDGIAYVVPSNCVSEITNKLKNAEVMENPEEWINALYAETPTVVEYCKAKKKRMPLPEYEVVRKAGIAEAEACIRSQLERSYQEKKRIIAFVNGVPGAGKTLLGVDLAYDSHDAAKGMNSVFMSGNGPLVAVLQDALDDNFIKNIHEYIDQYTSDGAPDFHANICIFDEGQRTWTPQQRKNKRKDRPDMSEADLFIEMLDRQGDWCFLLVLIGEGQEINSGEENGMGLWLAAIGRSQNKWEILCPPAFDTMWSNAGLVLVNDERRSKLKLINSLRANGSDLFSSAVNRFVSGNITEASELFYKSKKLHPMFVTQDLEQAKVFCRKYYQGIEDKRYGLIASSQAMILEKYGVNNGYENTKQTRAFPAKWYNAPVSSPLSCCALDKPVTEFGCQGLELDMPIVCWEKDFVWHKNSWKIRAKGRTGEYTPTGFRKQYRINTYRVLLTRGRDGLIVYVPPEPELTSTHDLLKHVGFEELKYNV